MRGSVAGCHHASGRPACPMMSFQCPCRTAAFAVGHANGSMLCRSCRAQGRRGSRVGRGAPHRHGTGAGARGEAHAHRVDDRTAASARRQDPATTIWCVPPDRRVCQRRRTPGETPPNAPQQPHTCRLTQRGIGARPVRAHHGLQAPRWVANTLRLLAHGLDK